MYRINWAANDSTLTPEKFLAEYWQKKPLLIKNALPNFADPIEADELAGLAMEADIESRIVSRNNASWNVEHGPFDDFAQFGENDWTLLVQATNNWSSETHTLLNPFRFIPNWRLDDVMVSFSTPNGGVGAHTDQYDVFIIQGQGKRRWQVGLPDAQLETLIPHSDLKQVSDFPPIIDEITEPGDLLYIPANHPHNGVAIDNSMNYSIGFQAPNPQELWSSFADIVIDADKGTKRFSDPDRTATNSPEQINTIDIEQLKQFMLETLNDGQLFNQFIGKHLTSSHHTLDVLPPEESITIEELKELVESSDTLEPVLGLKALLSEDKSVLFVNGENFQVVSGKQQNSELGFVTELAKTQQIDLHQVDWVALTPDNKELLLTMVNNGYWYFD